MKYLLLGLSLANIACCAMDIYTANYPLAAFNGFVALACWMSFEHAD